MAMKEIGPGWDRENRNAINDNFKEAEARLNTVTAKAMEQIGDEFEAFKAKNDTNFLDAVATVAERDSKYPQPKHGDTVRVTGEAAYYRYETGTRWKKTDEYNPAAIDNLNQQLAGKANKGELKVTDARIDNLVANAGNTDGNAELLDLRVGADGEVYATAGEAVRTAIPKIKDVDSSESAKFDVVLENEELSLEWNTPPEPVGLDTMTQYGVSYRDLFIKKNALTNSHFNNDLNGYEVTAGTPAATTGTYNTPSKSLNVSGTTSQQVRTTPPGNGRKYYVALKVKVNRYVSGFVGFLLGRTDISQTIGMQSITDGFVTKSVIATASPDYTTTILTIGSISGANADAFIDDVVYVDITDLSNPDIGTLDRLYDEYLNILKGTPELKPGTKKVNLVSHSDLPKIQDIDHNEESTFSLKKEHGDLFIKQKRASKDITLDSTAMYNKSYRELFVTRNFIKNSHFNDGLNGYAIAAGTPAVTTEAYNSPSNSLKVFGTTSQQVRVLPTAEGRKYYVGMMIRVDRYVQGDGVGYQFGRSDKPSFNGVKRVTEGFVRVSNIHVTDKAFATGIFTLGSINSANADGYVDDVVLIDITDLDAFTPNIADLDRLYDEYISIVSGRKTEPRTDTFKVAEIKRVYDYPHKIAVDAFVEKMNQKAAEIGMTNSLFQVPFSLTSTAYDLVKMGLQATGYRELMKVWKQKSYSFYTRGIEPRKVTVDTTVTDTMLESNYHIFGGKTGSGNALMSLVFLANAPGNNMFVGAIAGNPTDRFVATKELLDAATQIVNNPEGTAPDPTTTTIARGAITLVPTGNPVSYEGYNLPLLYSINENEVTSAASTAKTCNAMLTLDWIDDVNDYVEIVPEDLSYTEPYLKAGDLVRYKDLLHIMMLPSSNNAAIALARNVGMKILSQ